jgi:hypothetical protein
MLYFVAGFTALLVCAFCKLTGQRKGPNKGIMRYLGYAAESEATAGPGKGQQFQLGVNDEQRLYSSVELQKLTEAAQVLSDRGLGKAAMQETARHGLSPLLRCLPYQDVRTVSVVPVMHALCQGVIKDWLLAFLLSPNKPQPQRKQGMGASSLPKKRKRRQGQQQGEQEQGEQQEGEQQQGEQQEGEQQQDGGEQAQQQQQQQGTQPVGKGGQDTAALMLAPSQRAQMPIRKLISLRCGSFKGGLHPQQNRPVSDLVKLHGSLTLEELANGIRGIFAHLFWPVRVGNKVAEVISDPLNADAYGCLRAFAHFHLTDGEWESQELYAEAVDAAQEKILRYGAIAERVSE